MGTFFDSFSKLFSATAAVFDVWFIVFPPLLFALFKVLWLNHAQETYASKIKWVLLEIIPPRDVEKSPHPMELIFNGFSGVTKTSNTAEMFIIGEFPDAFSFEIASQDGQVHFYVRTNELYRNLVEGHFYAQYPDIELVEVPDYIYNVPHTIPNKDWDLFGADFELEKADLYPIRTYKFFEESVTGKMLDPLAGLIEVMAKSRPGEHFWLQYIVTPEKESWYKTGKKTIDEFLGKAEEKHLGFFGTIFAHLKDILSNLGRALFGSELAFSSGENGEKKDEAPVEFRLTPGEKDILKGLETNLGKYMYKVRMRYVYIARKELFSKLFGVSAFIGAMKQFNDHNANSLKPTDNSKTDAKYWFANERKRYRQRRLLRRYMARSNDPSNTRFYLSAEELATVFHIPDMSVTSPTLTRTASKRGGAPSNLPIQEI